MVNKKHLETLPYNEPSEPIRIRKKDGSEVQWDPVKIAVAISKSAERYNVLLRDDQIVKVVDHVLEAIYAENQATVPVADIHSYVEIALDEVGLSKVAKSYREFRDFKKSEAAMFKEIYDKDMENRSCNGQRRNVQKSGRSYIFILPYLRAFGNEGI